MMSPTRPAGISFGEALSLAKGLYEAIDVANTRETETYWAFPVRQIGCCGIVVDKQTGLTTPLGSAFGGLDTWLWGYDRGLVCDESVDFVVTEVIDVDRAAEVLRKLRIRPPEGRIAALQRLPAVFEQAVNWMALGELAADNESSFKWRVRRGGGGSQ